MPVNIIDAVPELSRKHFEEALKTARTSVTRTVIFIYSKGLGKI
jgi:hypothetical protein